MKNNKVDKVDKVDGDVVNVVDLVAFVMQSLEKEYGVTELESFGALTADEIASAYIETNKAKETE
jgi:hypothetical protein